MNTSLFSKYTIWSLSLLLFAIACSSSKPQGNSNLQISDLIEKQEYTFKARSVFPTMESRLAIRDLLPNSGNFYQIGGGYDVNVTPDSVIALLPYFGRAFSAPPNSREGAINFTSTKFEYKKSIKKNNVEIEIVLNDNQDVTNMFFTIAQNGSASLRLTFLNKTAIAYNGIIQKNK